MSGTYGKLDVELLIEAALSGDAAGHLAVAAFEEWTARVRSFDCADVRAVIFGGGTGLSTVLGGNAQQPAWPSEHAVGLKELFPRLHVVVCTTDDGRSTGRLLRQLPMIGIGDIRKCCVSLIRAQALQRTYGLSPGEAADLVRLIHCVFTHRFPGDAHDARCLADPLRVAPRGLRHVCPDSLRGLLCRLGVYLAPQGDGPTVSPAGHSLGNLLLSASVFMAAGGRTDRAPSLQAIGRGLDRVARAVGVRPGTLHPAMSNPGQLVLRYGNGVEVRGQTKSASAQRGFAVDRVVLETAGRPRVGRSICRAVREADLLIYAPGSVYTSILPVLQLQPLLDAVRANGKALKILGANFWVQEGETDISRRSAKRGFRVSELIEAYDQNIPGGVAGLFDVVLSANLQQMPGSTLRNYALEGKRPIFLDRTAVEQAGVRPIEVTLFSPERRTLPTPIHHDPQRFALAVRTLLCARRFLPRARRRVRAGRQGPAWPVVRRGGALCGYLADVDAALAPKRCRPASLRAALRELAWENRDIRPDHLRYFRGARVVRAARWGRSTEWDNILGYYDPDDGYLKIHEDVVRDPIKSRESLLVALGESLLGRYIETRRWLAPETIGLYGARCYEIRLRAAAKRECALRTDQLCEYLRLARMVQDASNPRVFRITLNSDEGFLPSGLLFGLLYAWYLDNRYAVLMEHEMSLLRRAPDTLVPHQLEERTRKHRLISFFREIVFRHPARGAVR